MNVPQSKVYIMNESTNAVDLENVYIADLSPLLFLTLSNLLNKYVAFPIA